MLFLSAANNDRDDEEELIKREAINGKRGEGRRGREVGKVEKQGFRDIR